MKNLFEIMSHIHQNTLSNTKMRLEISVSHFYVSNVRLSHYYCTVQRTLRAEFRKTAPKVTTIKKLIVYQMREDCQYDYTAGIRSKYCYRVATVNSILTVILTIQLDECSFLGNRGKTLYL